MTIPRELRRIGARHPIPKATRFPGPGIGALADGNRDHRETCQLADAIRSLLPALSALVAEADRIRTAA